jgi:hypothetical protein
VLALVFLLKRATAERRRFPVPLRWLHAGGDLRTGLPVALSLSYRLATGLSAHARAAGWSAATSCSGGKRAYRGRLGKDRSPP